MSEFMTEKTYELTVLALKGEAIQGKRSLNVSANLKDESTKWHEIISRLREEGIECEIDYYYGTDEKRSLCFRW